MALFGRRERPPRELLDALEADERVVSWADTDDGPELIAWHLVAKAQWSERGLVVTPARVEDDAFLVDEAPRSLALSVPRDLPPTIRKRVEGNVVRSELAATDSGEVRFVARRVPGADGAQWWAWFPPGVQPSDDARAAARARVKRLRAGEG